MLSDTDLQKIKKMLDVQSKDIKEEIKEFTRDYVRQGVDTVIKAMDEIVSHDVKPRLTKLEKIHPQGKHIFTN